MHCLRHNSATNQNSEGNQNQALRHPSRALRQPRALGSSRFAIAYLNTLASSGHLPPQLTLLLLTTLQRTILVPGPPIISSRWRRGYNRRPDSLFIPSAQVRIPLTGPPLFPPSLLLTLYYLGENYKGASAEGSRRRTGGRRLKNYPAAE